MMVSGATKGVERSGESGSCGQFLGAPSLETGAVDAPVPVSVVLFRLGET